MNSQDQLKADTYNAAKLNPMTVKEAAELLNLTERRVRQLCVKGILEARKQGRDWAINFQALRNFKEQDRPTGRPRKA